MCHWKYKMIDEKKERKKAEKDRREKGTQPEHQGDGPSVNQGDRPAESSNFTQETDVRDDHGNGDDETIDQDDGYDILNGDLMKDGVLVASGAAFETGGLLEDGRQVEGSTGDMFNGNGEDADMVMEDISHFSADDAATDSEIMLWER